MNKFNYTTSLLKERLMSARESLLVALSAAHLLEKKGSYTSVEEIKIAFSAKRPPKGFYWVQIREDSQGREFFGEEIFKGKMGLEKKYYFLNRFTIDHLRILVLGYWEIIDEFLENNPSLKSEFEQQDWYGFLKEIRNACVHKCRFKFNNKKTRKKIEKEEISWRNKVITLSLDGTNIGHYFFDYSDLWLLTEDIIHFVENLEKEKVNESSDSKKTKTAA